MGRLFFGGFGGAQGGFGLVELLLETFEGTGNGLLLLRGAGGLFLGGVAQGRGLGEFALEALHRLALGTGELLFAFRDLPVLPSSASLKDSISVTSSLTRARLASSASAVLARSVASRFSSAWRRPWVFADSSWRRRSWGALLAQGFEFRPEGGEGLLEGGLLGGRVGGTDPLGGERGFEFGDAGAEGRLEFADRAFGGLAGLVQLHAELVRLGLGGLQFVDLLLARGLQFVALGRGRGELRAERVEFVHRGLARGADRLEFITEGVAFGGNRGGFLEPGLEIGQLAGALGGPGLRRGGGLAERGEFLGKSFRLFFGVAFFRRDHLEPRFRGDGRGAEFGLAVGGVCQGKAGFPEFLAQGGEFLPRFGELFGLRDGGAQFLLAFLGFLPLGGEFLGLLGELASSEASDFSSFVRSRSSSFAAAVRAFSSACHCASRSLREAERVSCPTRPSSASAWAAERRLSRVAIVAVRAASFAISPADAARAPSFDSRLSRR